MRMRFPRLGRRDESGAAAIEFALIAPIYFLMSSAILETGLMFFANMTLQNAVHTTGRLIRTGQAQNQQMTQQQFRSEICSRIGFMLSCKEEDLLIDVRAFSDFGSADYPSPIDADGNLNGNLNSFQPGGSSQSSDDAIVLLRVFYKWPIFTPIFAEYFANLNESTRLISSSVAFKNEPF